MKNFKFLACLISASLFVNSCSRNPVTGKRQVVFMSEAQELAMGKEADPQIIATFGLYEDSSLQRFIREKGTRWLQYLTVPILIILLEL
jgi:predicted Zn-dependent protease